MVVHAYMVQNLVLKISDQLFKPDKKQCLIAIFHITEELMY